MTTPEIGKVLKFTMPDDKNRFVLVVIINNKIDYYTGLEDIGDLEYIAGQEYYGENDNEIRKDIDNLYTSGQLHWAYYSIDGCRLEEELMEKYIETNTDTVLSFDDWVRLNYDLTQLKGGN